MLVVQGAFWISDRCYNRYLTADASGNVAAADPGPRGLDLLNSTAPRNQIWLVEQATDGKNFRFRNYETGTALDIKNQNIGHGGLGVGVTSGSHQSQVWEVNWLEVNPLGAVYQIKNSLMPVALNVVDTYIYCSGYRSRTVGGYQPETQPYVYQSWLMEPVLLPTLYSLTNLAAPALVLRASDRPYASDDTSRGVALVPTELPARNQFWTFEYKSTGESIIRSASDHQFVLDLSAQNPQALVARKHHGGPSQLWNIRDEDGDNHIVSLANVKTDTLLATRKKQPLGGPSLDTLAVVIAGNTRWQI